MISRYGTEKERLPEVEGTFVQVRAPTVEFGVFRCPLSRHQPGMKGRRLVEVVYHDATSRLETLSVLDRASEWSQLAVDEEKELSGAEVWRREILAIPPTLVAQRLDTKF